MLFDDVYCELEYIGGRRAKNLREPSFNKSLRCIVSIKPFRRTFSDVYVYVQGTGHVMHLYYYGKAHLGCIAGLVSQDKFCMSCRGVEAEARAEAGQDDTARTTKSEAQQSQS